MSHPEPVVAAHIRVDGRYRCVSPGWARAYSPPDRYRPPRVWADLDHVKTFGLSGSWLDAYRAATRGEPTYDAQAVQLPGTDRPTMMQWSLLPMGDGSVLCVVVDAEAVADIMASRASEAVLNAD